MEMSRQLHAPVTQVPTPRGAPKRSPIQELTTPNVAYTINNNKNRL
jgi:hypothetical protein